MASAHPSRRLKNLHEVCTVLNSSLIARKSCRRRISRHGLHRFRHFSVIALRLADGPSRPVTTVRLSDTYCRRAGGTWNLQSLQPAGDVDQTTPAGASYTLTFADGRLTTRADCNNCGGEFTLSGQTLTAGPACWRARGQRVPRWGSSPPTPVCLVAKATCPCRTARWCCRRREECCASRDRPRMLWRRVSSMRHRVIGHCGGRARGRSCRRHRSRRCTAAVARSCS